MKKLLLLIILAAGNWHLAEAQMDFGMKVGQTYYDQQEANSAGKRIARKSNGAISIVWAESCLTDPANPASPTASSYATAGPGYNHFGSSGWVHGQDGTCDEPTANYGVFSERALSPELIVFPSGREVVIGHGASGLLMASRSQAGAGGMAGWSATQQIGPANAVGNAWPQVATSGSYLHMVASCDSCISASGVTSPIRYYRSADEGQTWNITDLDLPGVDTVSFNAIGAGNYAISANQNFVAIVAGAVRPGDQWAMWKSADNGTTWSKTVLRNFTLADTVTMVSNPNLLNHIGEQLSQHALFEGNDKHHSILVDNSGTVHAWSGYMLSGIDRANPQNATPLHMLSEGMWYWTESMSAPALLVNQREEIWSGWGYNWVAQGTYNTPPLKSPYGYTGLVSMPTAALAANGDIYVVYSGIVENTSNTGDSTGQSFRDLYLMRRSALGTWSAPVNLIYATTGTRTDFTEEVYPSVIPRIGNDNYLFLTFQADEEPGTRFTDTYDSEILNEIRFAIINVIPPISVVNPPLVSAPENESRFSVINLAPNPTSGIANLHLTFQTETAVSVSVTNVLGQQLLCVPVSSISAGQEQVLPLNLSAQPSGVYLCTVFVNGEPHTIRLLKE